MRTLGILQRLAKQAADKERQALLLIASEIEAIEGEIDSHVHEMACETSASLDFMTSGATLPAYVHAGKARIEALELKLAERRKAYQDQLENVQRERIEEKRFERLIERRKRETAQEAALKEQKVIDELASIKTSTRESRL